MSDEIRNENTADTEQEKNTESGADKIIIPDNSASDKGGKAKKSKKKDKKKSKKKIIIILLCLLMPFVILFAAVGGLYLSVMKTYNDKAYVDAPIVERTNAYVEPPTDPQAPEWEEAVPGENDIGRDFIAPGQPIPKDRKSVV